jgi:hypothetical protein
VNKIQRQSVVRALLKAAKALEAGSDYVLGEVVLSLVPMGSQPFNQDTVQKLTRISVHPSGKGGDESEHVGVNLRSHKTSPILNRLQEKKAKRETVVVLSCPKGAERATQAAAQKALAGEFKVSLLEQVREPKTVTASAPTTAALGPNDLEHDHETLSQFIDMALEGVDAYTELDQEGKRAARGEARITPDITSAAAEVDSQVLRFLRAYFPQTPEGDQAADACYAENGPYNVLMTSLGHGVGIWDGRWDHLAEEYGFDLKDMDQKLKADRQLGKACEDLDVACYMEAADAVDRVLAEEETEE